METNANSQLAHPETAPTSEIAGGRWQDATAEEVVQRVQHLRDEEHVKQAKIAQETNIPNGTLSQVLSGSYRGRSERYVEKLAKWLDEREQRAAFRPEDLAGPGYFETPTAQAVQTRIQTAHYAQKMAMIVGVPGCGKSRAAQRYAELHGHNAWYTYFHEFCGDRLNMLVEIALALGLEVPKGNQANAIFKAICKRLARTRGVLLIDEADHLDKAALDGLRAIHDVAGVSIVLLANPELYRRIHSGHGTAKQFAQFTRRVVIKFHIDKIAQGDVEAQAQAWGITDKACVKTLRQISQKPGGMGAVDATLLQATLLARAGESAITPDILREAYASHDQGGL